MRDFFDHAFQQRVPTRFNHRQFLGTTAGLATLLGLGFDAALAQDATPASDAERTVETIHGPVTVPYDPQRIIAINFPSAVALLELGVMPVGIPSYLPALPANYPSTAEILAIENDAGEIDLEKIVSLTPDLILGSDWKDPAQQQAPYEQLAAIAPTALFEWTMAAGNWAGEAAGCAEAIGKSAELNALRTFYEQRAELIKTTYADTIAKATWDILSASETNWYLYGPTTPRHDMLALSHFR